MSGVLVSHKDVHVSEGSSATVSAPGAKAKVVHNVGSIPLLSETREAFIVS